MWILSTDTASIKHIQTVLESVKTGEGCRILRQGIEVLGFPKRGPVSAKNWLKMYTVQEEISSYEESDLLTVMSYLGCPACDLMTPIAKYLAKYGNII